uniref:Protein sleepless n=1 Tax=Meloidogyne incognita TaxID=6306 RepID=A0A914LJ62_MELIC
MNLKFGDSTKCIAELDFKHRNGTHSIIKSTTCNTEELANGTLGNKCFKNDCGEHGFMRHCGPCIIVNMVSKEKGYENDCTCHQCETDLCNSALGFLSNMKIMFLLCLIIFYFSGI